MKRLMFILIQALWGFPQTLLGLVLYLANRKMPHVNFHGAIVTPWNRSGSVSLGPFIFLSNKVKDEFVSNLVVHEYGHCVQSLIFGPAYLLIVGIPSIIWGEWPTLQKKREENDLPYFTFFTERFANYLGTKLTGRDAMQGY